LGCQIGFVVADMNTYLIVMGAGLTIDGITTIKAAALNRLVKPGRNT